MGYSQNLVLSESKEMPGLGHRRMGVTGWPAKKKGRKEKGERGGSLQHPYQPVAEAAALASVTVGFLSSESSQCKL